MTTRDDDAGSLNGVKILLHDEVQLLDWGESRGTGPWVKLRLPNPEHLDVFRGMDTATLKRTGHIFNMTLAEGDLAQVTPPDAPHPLANWSRALHRCGFFRAPAVWRAVGTDAEYQDYVRQLPCLICRAEPPNEYAHVRITSAEHGFEGGGTGHKPVYSGVPMCSTHHRFQHQHGYAALHQAFLDVRSKGYKTTEDGAKAWLLRMAMRNVEEWAHWALVTLMGEQSLNDVIPVELAEWAQEQGVAGYLPAGFLVDALPDFADSEATDDAQG